MAKMLIDRQVVEHALHVAMAAEHPVKLIAALRAALAEPVQEPDNKAASIRWQLCLLAQTEEFSDEVRNQIGRGVWLIDRLTEAALAEPQEPVAWIHTDPDKRRVKFLEWRENEPGYRGDWIKTPLYTAPPSCPNCASLQDQNTELDRKLAELTSAVLRANGIGGTDAL